MNTAVCVKVHLIVYGAAVYKLALPRRKPCIGWDKWCSCRARLSWRYRWVGFMNVVAGMWVWAKTEE